MTLFPRGSARNAHHRGLCSYCKKTMERGVVYLREVRGMGHGRGNWVTVVVELFATY